MNPKSQFIDTPELDEFFRQGDEQTRGADSLQPVVAIDDPEMTVDARDIRTPAQRERRARFIKFVSMTMALLTIGSAGAALQVVKRGEHAVAALNPSRALPDVRATGNALESRETPGTAEPLGSEAAKALPAPSASNENSATPVATARLVSAPSGSANAKGQSIARAPASLRRNVSEHGSAGKRIAPASARLTKPSSPATKPENYRPPTASFADD